MPVILLADKPVMIMGDTEELRRAVANLLDNAVRYARSRVEVRVNVNHEQALINVSDD